MRLVEINGRCPAVFGRGRRKRTTRVRTGDRTDGARSGTELTRSGNGIWLGRGSVGRTGGGQAQEARRNGRKGLGSAAGGGCGSWLGAGTVEAGVDLITAWLAL